MLDEYMWLFNDFLWFWKLVLWVGIGLTTLILIILLYVYWKPSDELVRTYLYALLFLFVFCVPALVIYEGWWLAPLVVVLLVTLIKKVDEAEPVPGWKHPW